MKIRFDSPKKVPNVWKITLPRKKKKKKKKKKDENVAW